MFPLLFESNPPNVYSIGKWRLTFLHCMTYYCIITTHFYIALFTPGGCPQGLHTITPGHWPLIHSLNHLSSLVRSIQPCATLICVTRLNQSQEPSQVPIYPCPWVERSNYSGVSCSETQVSRPGFEQTLWWTEAPELEFGAPIHSAITPYI